MRGIRFADESASTHSWEGTSAVFVGHRRSLELPMLTVPVPDTLRRSVQPSLLCVLDRRYYCREFNKDTRRCRRKAQSHTGNGKVRLQDLTVRLAAGRPQNSELSPCGVCVCVWLWCGDPRDKIHRIGPKKTPCGTKRLVTASFFCVTCCRIFLSRRFFGWPRGACDDDDDDASFVFLPSFKSMKYTIDREAYNRREVKQKQGFEP